MGQDLSKSIVPPPLSLQDCLTNGGIDPVRYITYRRRLDKLNDFTYEKKSDSDLNFMNYCEKFMKNRAVPTENTFSTAFKRTLEKIVKIYYKQVVNKIR